MKIAIVCDWLVTLGGAEKVLAEMLACYPQADLFAVVDFLSEQQRGFLNGKQATTTFIQRLPFAKRNYRRYLPLMPLAIEQLDLSAYDVILSSSHAVAKGVLTGPDQLHICYIHSPMRYAWDLQHQYLRESNLDKKVSGLLARYFLHKLRLWDARTAVNVDYFLANSQFVAKRVQKTYRREAEVLYPPVDLEQFQPQAKKENFFFTASRFVPYKRIDLIVEAFKLLPDEHLFVIGDGPEYQKIKAKAPRNVTLLGYQPDHVLIDYLQRANAFIFAAEEDFGILPLEAQACGTPVIAYGKGGALETVRGLKRQSEPTGLFFPQQEIATIAKAIAHFKQNAHEFTADLCVKNARRFSPTHFRQQLMQFVNDKWQHHSQK